MYAHAAKQIVCSAGIGCRSNAIKILLFFLQNTNLNYLMAAFAKMVDYPRDVYLVKCT